MDKSEDCQLVVAKRYTRRGERLKIVEKWRRTGLSASEYSEKSGINVGTLCRWGREAVPMRETTPFIELQAAASGAWTAEVTSKEGSVRFSPSACPVWAAALIRELNRC